MTQAKYDGPLGAPLLELPSAAYETPVGSIVLSAQSPGSDYVIMDGDTWHFNSTYPLLRKKLPLDYFVFGEWGPEIAHDFRDYGVSLVDMGASMVAYDGKFEVFGAERFYRGDYSANGAISNLREITTAETYMDTIRSQSLFMLRPIGEKYLGARDMSNTGEYLRYDLADLLYTDGNNPGSETTAQGRLEDYYDYNDDYAVGVDAASPERVITASWGNNTTETVISFDTNSFSPTITGVARTGDRVWAGYYTSSSNAPSGSGNYLVYADPPYDTPVVKIVESYDNSGVYVATNGDNIFVRFRGSEKYYFSNDGGDNFTDITANVTSAITWPNISDYFKWPDGRIVFSGNKAINTDGSYDDGFEIDVASNIDANGFLDPDRVIMRRIDSNTLGIRVRAQNRYKIKPPQTPPNGLNYYVRAR